MKSLNLKLKRLSVQHNLPPSFYKEEAKYLLKKYNISDINFKFLFKEFVDKAKESVDVEVLRDVISDLQRHVALRYSKENNNEEEHFFVNNKIKQAKRERRSNH